MCEGKWHITEMHNNELLLLANVQKDSTAMHCETLNT